MQQISLPGLRRAAVCTGVLAAILSACAGCKATATVASGGSTVSVSTSSAANAGSGAGGASGIQGTAGNGAGAASGSGSTGSSGSSGSGSSGSSGGMGGDCLTQNLSVSIAGDNPGAGKDNLNLVFENVGNTTCTLYGYPGVSFGAGSPDAQVGQPASRTSGSPSAVSLVSGGEAYAPLTVDDALNFPASSCNPTSTTELRIYPPANTTLLYVSYQSKACTSSAVTMQIGPVQAGSGK